MDPANGASYTRSEFGEFYGGFDEWERAVPVGGQPGSIPVELDVAAIRQDLQHGSSSIGGMDEETGEVSGAKGEEGWYEVEEEVLVMDESWADHFLAQAKAKVSAPKKRRAAGPDSSGPGAAHAGDSSAKDASSQPALKSRPKNGPRSKKRGGGNTFSSSGGGAQPVAQSGPGAGEVVTRWKGIRYASEHLLRVRQLEADARRAAAAQGKGRWPVYPEAPITALRAT